MKRAPLLVRGRAYFQELGGEPGLVILGACALLILSHHQGSAGFFRDALLPRFAGSRLAGTLPLLYWFWASVVLYLCVPLMLSKLTGGSFHRGYGLGRGDWRAGLALCGLLLAVMIPTVLIASRWPSFQGRYPLAGTAAYTLTGGQRSLALFALYELSYVAYFVGWEFLFRGWMLNALLPRFGRAGAILIPTAPFVLMHLGKPELEALGSIVAGVALGILALRTRSFWYGALLHAAVAVLMDVVSLTPP